MLCVLLQVNVLMIWRIVLNWQFLWDETIPKHHGPSVMMVATEKCSSRHHHNHLSGLHARWLEAAAVSVNNWFPVDWWDWSDWSLGIFRHELNTLKNECLPMYYLSIVHHIQHPRLPIHSNPVALRSPERATHRLATTCSHCSPRSVGVGHKSTFCNKTPFWKMTPRLSYVDRDSVAFLFLEASKY